MTPEEKSLLCIKCQKCCKESYIRIRSWEEYNLLKVKGFTVKVYYGPVKTAMYFLIIYQDCQHLTPEGCAIYDYRPHSCRVYKGTSDPFMKDRCMWREEE